MYHDKVKAARELLCSTAHKWEVDNAIRLILAALDEAERENMAAPKVHCACHPGVRWPTSEWGKQCAITASEAHSEVLAEALRVATAPQACDGSGHTTIYHFGESGAEEGCEEVACPGCCACAQSLVGAVLARHTARRKGESHE